MLLLLWTKADANARCMTARSRQVQQIRSLPGTWWKSSIRLHHGRPQQCTATLQAEHSGVTSLLDRFRETRSAWLEVSAKLEHCRCRGLVRVYMSLTVAACP